MNIRFQPSSLRQLILIGFFVSLIPLAVLLWQSTKVLRQISRSSIAYSQQSSDLVRNAETMDDLLIDIERAIKQFTIVKTDALAELANAHLKKYQDLQQRLCAVSPLDLTAFCSTQQQQIGMLTSNFTAMDIKQLDPIFNQTRQQQQRLMTSVWSYLDQSIEQQREYVEQQQRRMNILLVSLVLATFALIVLMSGRLAAPVKLLEEKIKLIGAGENAHHDKSEKFVGPEEFQLIYERLNWLSARLEQLESLRQAFLRHAAHELKTPLSSIKEGCSILSEQLAGPLTQQQIEVIKLLDEGVDRLRHLTDQLLDYNYLLQQTAPTLVSLNPNDLIQECLSIYDLAFRKRQQQVTVECDLSDIYSDHKLFTRILDNLLSNAQAYGEQNGKVLIRLSRQNREAILIVANTGERVPADQGPLLFKPFHRGGAVRQDAIKGTGLGLSIVHDCARLLGGKAELLESEQYQFGVIISLPQL
ncbi:sensor histidine kinase [Gynuella sp.]|uniref:sensor histidine kinase n=1 Tax=Gynuella sp. TaxID=2969146 RepID=UPI003D0EA3C2